ncbi:MAG: B12-binding domain-containing radical SAM protein [bacterium]|jgi:radical SAM superfamily enzyme YgiQ (UPF0313 family)
MRILLVYPEYPATFWSFKYALGFISKKAVFPPLGLLTVASMLPEEFEARLIDMNVESLRDRDIDWADYVFVSAMSIQRDSAVEVISRCRALETKTVVGGPLFSSEPEDFEEADHLVLNEAEVTMPRFIADLLAGCPRHVYTTDELPSMELAPIPKWDLLDMSKYQGMSVQFSRGCPFDCEFCNISALFGHKVRTKSTEQTLAELESLYTSGWRGSVFFVDDNFIGNKRALKKVLLPAIIEWMEKRKRPFYFNTEVSVDLSDDEELMDLMVRSGFVSVFVGIETPNEASLAECSKLQNKNRDLLACVKKMQDKGLRVQAGFIVGFDSDPVSTFDSMIAFIQKSGIVTAMVGLLNAPRGTKLHKRLDEEGRLLRKISGDNTDFTLNFIPKMEKETLVGGYERVVSTIYSAGPYYERVRRFLREFNPPRNSGSRLSFRDIKSLFKSSLHLGIVDRERWHYWRIVLWSLFKRPRVLPLTVTFAAYGFHFRKIFRIS